MRNQIVPCPIRDHHPVALEMITLCGASPANPEAAAAMQDTVYHTGMEQYGRKVAELTDTIWAEEYGGDGRSKGDGKK
jgi:hypothetical protein